MDENGRHIVERREDIPAFVGEGEERVFWETHTLGGALLDEMGLMDDSFLPPSRPRTKPVPIRFSEDVIARAKALAVQRHTGYQTLIKEFVTERLYEEEKRAGLR